MTETPDIRRVGLPRRRRCRREALRDLLVSASREPTALAGHDGHDGHAAGAPAFAPAGTGVNRDAIGRRALPRDGGSSPSDGRGADAAQARNAQVGFDPSLD